MSYVIVMPDGRFVKKGDGTNSFVESPREATTFHTIDDAIAGKPGHHYDMGGSGFKGRVVPYDQAAMRRSFWRD